jgi:predicted short-subunit dehydrogenase-like oxidoreductase (DUF2520 family)
LAHALAMNLTSIGWKVSSIVVRPKKQRNRAVRRLANDVHAQVQIVGGPIPASHLVWICVPDSAIAEVAAALAEPEQWKGRIAFHSSGALTSEELKPLRQKGASVASVHPGMTFVHQSTRSMREVPFGIEGDAPALLLAREIIANFGGTAVEIPKNKKTLYHVFDTFASPMLVALMAALEKVGSAAGIPQKELRKMAGPLLRQTLENYLTHGAQVAFTGAFVRGDEGVVRKHVNALKEVPLARDVYLALARVAMEHLPVKNRRGLRKALAQR